MNIPPEYTKLQCGSFRLENPTSIDYTNQYWGNDLQKSSIEEQCYNVNGYRNARGETKSFSVLRHCVGRSILEIGCSPGEFMKVASGAGFECCGIDPCKGDFDFVSKRSCGTIVNGFFPHIQLPVEEFDTIVAMDVIEHVDDPETFVRSAMDLLTYRGRLILMMPALYDDGLFDEKNFCSEHINIFSQKKLRSWLKPILFDRWMVGHEIVVIEK